MTCTTGSRAEVEEATRLFLERGWSAEKTLNDALVEGMRIVGIDFRDGILFVPEVLLAANSMKGGMEILRPLLAETGVPPIGKIVIGTVKGDIHDIGKNLVSMMLEGAGFEVIDLGINNPVEKYLAALEQHKPDILGMSALLTTTMPYMKVVIDKMKEIGHPQRLHRAGRRCAAQRGIRQGGGRGRLLPRCGHRRGDRQEPARRAPCARAPPDCERAVPERPWTRAAAPWSSPAARSRARSRRLRRANGWSGARRALPAGGAAQPPRAHRAGGARRDPREARALRADLRRLWRLRHARRAGCACSRRKASSVCPARTATSSWPPRASSRSLRMRSPARST